MIRSTFLLTLVYAVILMMLGYMGYSAGSLISLIISGSLGLLILASLVLVVTTKKDWPYYITMGILGFLFFFFAYRFGTSKNFMPGAMCAFTVLTLSVIATKVFSHRRI